MLLKSTLLSFFWMLSLARVASASPVQNDSIHRTITRHNSTNQVIAQVNEDAEAIILTLGLTDEQIVRLNQVDRQLNPRLDQLYRAWNAAQEELEVLIRSEDASESEVRNKYEEVESLRRQISELQFERRMAIREILRPEQRLPYAKYIEQRIAESDS